MQLVGSKVIHKLFGSGVITEHTGRYITVSFAAGDKKFVYPEAFRTSMRAADPQLSLAIHQVLFQDRPCGDSLQYFLVFQNQTFRQEAEGGYLWAPKANATGHPISHWKLLQSVRPGDIIFHSVTKQITAISIASGYCYSAKLPDELRHQKPWTDEGWRLDVQYIFCPHPVLTSDYMDTLRSLQPLKHGPFNVRGRDNSGYLFVSNKELSRFLFERLVRLNPELQSYAAILGLGEE